MFGTIRKHQTWLWGVIITITVICFVFFFSPANRGTGQGRASANHGSINGERITDEDYENARREIELEYFFMSGGNWMTSEAEAEKAGFYPERELYFRLLLNQKQQQMGIHVSSETAGQFATGMLHQFGSPEAFVTKMLEPRGLNMADLDRFVRHELGNEELRNTIGLSGKLITPQEAQALYVREHQELSTKALFFDGSNYMSGVQVPAAAVAEFYTNHIPEYKIPERVQVSYVKFPYSNHIARAEQEMTNLTEIIEANLQRMGSNYVRYGKTPEEAKAKIREELLLQRVRPEVRKEAIAFANPLSETNAPTLEQLAKKSGLTVSVTPPFDIATGPTNMDVGPEFTRTAFALSAGSPVPEPIISHDGVYVIEFKNRLPPEIPPLEKIHDRVVADFKFTEGIKLARKAGEQFVLTLTNGLAQGKTFDAIAGSANVKPVTLPPLSLSTRSMPEVEDRIPLNADRNSTRLGLKDIAFSTPPGKASGFHQTDEGGIILYVREKLPLDETRMKSELPAFTSYVRQSRSREAFNAWFTQEIRKGLVDTPVLQQQRAPAAKS